MPCCRIVRRQLPKKPHQFSSKLHPVLAKIYQTRGVDSEPMLQLSLARSADFRAFKGLEAALGLLVKAIKNAWSILIVGDFDADGATSTAIMIDGLKALGAVKVDYLVPNRFEYGYGLTPELVDLAIANKPDLIITVDNGISSIEGVAKAKEAGIFVIITDHHLPGDRLPIADAILNPNQPGCHFESKNLAGCGVAFYLLCALRARLREIGWFQGGLKEPNLAQFLDLVALGTIADVVKLDQTNRILVHQGLQRIRAGKARPGINALLQVTGKEAAYVTSMDLGFAIAPKLNAAGRLDDMSLGIEMLLSQHVEPAKEIAQVLVELNKQRGQIEKEMQQQAELDLDRLLRSDNPLPIGICLYQAQWHQGVIGILASRIKERLHRPVVLFAEEEKGSLKGSARSISGFHIRDALALIDNKYPNLIKRFGGHAMAAGLTINQENFSLFCEAFDQVAKSLLTSEQLNAELITDGCLDESDLNLDLAECLQKSGPWGQGFAEPLFDGEFHVVDKRWLADRHLKLQLKPINSELYLDAIAFNLNKADFNQEFTKIKAVYRLGVNRYLGRVSLQLVIEHLETLS